jgi:hypothetical protein
VDVFVTFRAGPGSLLVRLQLIFDYVKMRGARWRANTSSWPAGLSNLPPGTPLVAEALQEAVERDVDGTRARVFTAEHLAAIALQTGRAKDKARLLQFVEAGALDAVRFQAILARHGLVAVWRKFERQFLSDAP